MTTSRSSTLRADLALPEPGAATAESGAATDLQIDDLVEDVSIDGMCGVY